MNFILLTAGVYCWATFSILMHEMAHLAVGRIMGLRPKCLRVGKGWEWLRIQIRGVEVVFAIWPLIGAAYVVEMPLRWMRWRGSAFAIAGLLANVAMAWSLWQLLDGDLVDGIVRKLVIAALIWEGYFIFVNIIPDEVDAYGSLIGTDGKQVFDYITGRMPRRLFRGYEMDIRRYDPEFDVRKSVTFQGISKMQEVHKKVLSAYEAGRTSEYLEACRLILDCGELLPGERAQVLDAMACQFLQHGHEAARSGAMAWAEEAYRMFPTSRTVCGTYGALLVENGKYEAGIDVLKVCTGAAGSQMDRGISSCFTAKAHHKLGNDEETRQWLLKAKEIGGCEEVYARIAPEIEGGNIAARAG